jgi:hypothetical protein
MHWCITAYVGLRPAFREKTERLLRQLPGHGCWAAAVEPDVPGTGTRREIAGAFTLDDLARTLKAGVVKLTGANTLADVDKSTLQVFVAGSLGDRRFLAAANRTARAVARLREDTLAALHITNVIVTGVFLLEAPASLSDSQRQDLYAFLRELSTVQQPHDGGRALYDTTLFLENSNVSPDNQTGFQNLGAGEFEDLVSEVLAAFQCEPVLTERLPAQREDGFLGSAGVVALHLNYDQIVRRLANGTAIQLLDQLFAQAGTEVTEKELARFWADGSLPLERLEAIVLGGAKKDSHSPLSLLWFPASLWENPVKSWIENLKLGFIRHLSLLPARIAAYGSYVVSQRVRALESILAAHAATAAERVVGDLRPAVDVLLGQFTPGEARAFLTALRERLESARKELASNGVREANPFGFPGHLWKAGFEKKTHTGMPNLEYYYAEMEDAVANRPLALALFSRFVFLGVIVGLAADIVIGRSPDFLLNIGFLKWPGVPLVITLALFVAFGTLKYWRTGRRWRLARDWYIAAVETIATARARLALQNSMDSVYDRALEAVRFERGELECLKTRFDELSLALATAPEEEPRTRFHVPLEDGKMADGSAVLRTPPKFEYRYESNKAVDWNVETHDFVGLMPEGRPLVFGAWRELAAATASALDEFRSRLLEFAGRGYQHIRQKSIADRLGENNLRHNQALSENLRCTAFAPAGAEEIGAAPLQHRYFWIGAENGRYGALVPSSEDTLASKLGAYLRVVHLLAFQPVNIGVFRTCRQEFDALSPSGRTALQLAEYDTQALIDPITGLQERPPDPGGDGFAV